MIIYILLSGIAIGIGVGFCIKLMCCNNDRIFMEQELQEQQEADIRMLHTEAGDEDKDYINYLENMLDNSTEVNTKSFILHHVDVSFNNLSPEFVFVPPNSPSNVNMIETILCDISYASVEEV